MTKREQGNLQANGYEPGRELLVRTPMLPVDWLLRWGAGLTAPSAKPGERAEQILADERLLRRRLLLYCEDPLVQEALFVASPSLVEAMKRWDGEADSRSGQATALGITRYFTRMASRSTPFGLFSSCSMGTTAGSGGVVLGGRELCRRHVRVDTHYVILLATALEKIPSIRSRLRFRPSDALVRWPDRVSFPAVDPGPGRTFSLVALDSDEALSQVLNSATVGKTLDDLAHELESDDVTFHEAREYCSELAESGALKSELQPAVWGDEPLDHVAAVLTCRAPQADETRLVEQLRSELRAIVRQPMGAPQQAYDSAKALLGKLPVEDERARTLQVDLSRPLTSSSLPPSVLEDLASALPVLERLAAISSFDALETFKREFERRYQHEEVPLLEALDEERGLAFPKMGAENRDPAPLLEGLLLRRPSAARAGVAYPLDAGLLPHLVGIWQRGEQEWALSASDIASLCPGGGGRLPDSVSILFQVLAADHEAVANGDYQVALQSCWGPSGAMLLGRFCHADPAILEATRAIVAREEALDPDAVFAEISHVPEGRAGNVVCRPKFRSHYVSYFGGGTGGAEDCIPASDLRVRLARGEFVLRSHRLDRRVVVRLTTAHNHRNSGLSVYRFLCAVQGDGLVHADLQWGSFRSAPFLPRVRIGRVIVSPAAWRLSLEQVRRLGQSQSTIDRFEAAQRLRAELQLPRYVYLSDGDMKLLIDLDNAMSVNALTAASKRDGDIRLTEAFDPSRVGFVGGPEGAYIHEFAVPFIRRRTLAATEPAAAAAPKAQPRERAPSHNDTAVPTLLLPGTEWLSLKVYGGPGDLEKTLLERLLPHLADEVRRRRVSSWFFIRFRDPDPHLRLRLRGDQKILGGEVLPALARAIQPLIADGILRRVEVDTYEREVERYGGSSGIVLSEQVFEADSIAAGEVLSIMAGLGLEDERWRAALIGMHHLLCDFCDGVDVMLATVQEQRRVFGYEFGIGISGERAFGQRFREKRLTIERWLAGGFDLPGVSQAYAKRSRALAPLVRELKSLEREERLCQPLTGCRSILASYLHMHAIRIFRSHTREQELLLYDFLARSYRSQLARGRKRPAPDRDAIPA